MLSTRVVKISAALGDALVARGRLDKVSLTYMRQKSAVDKEPLWRRLIADGLLSEMEVVQVLADVLGLPFKHVAELAKPQPAAVSSMSLEFCRSGCFLPLAIESGRLVCVIGDNLPEHIEQSILSRTGLRASFVMAPFSDVRRLILDHFLFAKLPAEGMVAKEVEALALDTELGRSPEAWLGSLLHWAVRERATDIHITPSNNSMHVLMRVDGVLRPLFAMPARLQRVLSFIKLTAEMDISEQRRPQDGSFRRSVYEQALTVRVSTIVTEYGERMVMRLLPESGEARDLRTLGFAAEAVEAIERCSKKSSGLILVTGPTGAGKSSTLHACLRTQHLIERNVLTVEDPLEYRVPAAGQTEVNRRAGYDFGTALRHFLRHDPDVILLGEMRDAETAQAAFDAAATGHLVLSTLHVTSVFGVLPRLRPFELSPQVVAENLSLILNQRLVRRVCSACEVPLPFTSAQSEWLGLSAGSVGRVGVGCPACGDTGYRGRVPVYELLVINDAVANGIASGALRADLREIALQSGFVPIVQMAKARIAAGETTFSEIFHAIGEGPL